MCAQENINLKVQDGDKRNNLLGESSEKIYYSWKKRHEASIKNDSRKNSLRKFQSASLHSNPNLFSEKASKDSRFNSTNKTGNLFF